MAVSLLDMDALRRNEYFKNRVRAAIFQGGVSVAGEGWEVPFHRERATFVTQIVREPDSWLDQFCSSIATDTNVINAATANGTVAITTANGDTQQGLVSDNQIRVALAAVFNAFLRAPAT